MCPLVPVPRLSSIICDVVHRVCLANLLLRYLSHMLWGQDNITAVGGLRCALGVALQWFQSLLIGLKTFNRTLLTLVWERVMELRDIEQAKLVALLCTPNYVWNRGQGLV